MPHLTVPIFASRCVVTSTAANAELLRAMYPEARVRVAPLCGGRVSSVPPDESGAHPATSGADPLDPRSVRFAVFDDRARGADVIDRAMQRARDAGASFEIVAPDSDANMLLACDVVIAPGWPPFHFASTAVLAGMAAGKTVVTMEMDATSEWPAMDPQTWQPRGIAVSEPPIAVTIDPRDEEHSLMLAIRRLSSDAALRGQLGSAGHTWWKGHATPAHAAAAWRQIIEEAVRLSPPPRPADWPKQFASDGTELAREILSEFGLPATSLWDLGRTGSPTDIPARS